MDKLSYLSAVREKLAGLPEEDVQKSLDYYIELIDDRMEDGLTEEEAVAAMPSPEEAAEQILLEQPLVKVVKARVRPNRKLQFWEILLLVLGSPVWLPLVLTAGILLLTLYLLIWVAALVLWTLDLSFAAAGIAGVAGAVMSLSRGGPGSVPMCLGLALAGAGLAILFYFVCLRASKGSFQLGKAFVRWIKARFIRKEESV